MKTLKDLVRDWGVATSEMQNYTGRLPDVIGMTGVKVIQDNFRLQGYDDGNSIKRWPKRDPATNRSYTSRKGVKGTVFNAANKILEQTGNLKQAVGYKKKGEREVFFGVDESLVPYAKIHNEGLKGLAFGKHPFMMPRRQFMPTDAEGANLKMQKAFDKKVSADIGKIMSKFKMK